jgi:hypothetical protein
VGDSIKFGQYRDLTSNNSFVKSEYMGESGEPVWAYGIIQKLFVHKLHPAHEGRAIVRCHWYTEVEELSHRRPGVLLAIRRDERIDALQRFEFVDELHPQNLSFVKNPDDRIGKIVIAAGDINTN